MLVSRIAAMTTGSLVLRPRAVLSFVLALTLSAGLTQAQTDVPAEQQNLPPVAAPTSKIQVGEIAVVRSESQEASDFATGLITGLVAAYRVSGLAIAVVQQDHVMFASGFGTATPATPIALGSLDDLFASVAAMQQAERGKIALDQDVSKAMGETSPRGYTLADLLTRAKGDPRLLAAIVAKASGQDFDATVKSQIADPLMMPATAHNDAGWTSTTDDMTHLVIALLNGGAFMGGQILQPMSVDRMEQTQRSVAPELPGWAYGFSEMRRNGHRALQHDGRMRGAEATQTRFVLVPEAKLGYIVAVRGRAPARFWRELDDALFDKLLPRGAPESSAANAPAPAVADARSVTGVYVPARDPGVRLATLKLGNEPIRVRARGDGALVLEGALTGVLAPRVGGTWSSDDGNIVASMREGRFMLGADLYRRIALWRRPDFYAWLALLAALAGAGGVIYERRKTTARIFPSDAVLGAGAAAFMFVIASLLVWLLSPFSA